MRELFLIFLISSAGACVPPEDLSTPKSVTGTAAETDGGDGSTAVDDEETETDVDEEMNDGDEDDSDGTSTGDTGAAAGTPTGGTATGSEDDPPPAPLTIGITGSLVLGDNVIGADSLVAGNPIHHGIVFVKGFPNITAETDELGAFSLSITLPTQAGLTAANDYKLVMWHTTPINQKKIGTQRDITVEPGEVLALEQPVPLGYTKRAEFRLLDNLSQEITNFTSVCTISFPGYEGKISVAPVNGRLGADYLPPATYSVVVTCPGYEPKESQFTVGSGDGWFQVDVEMTPVTP